METIYEVIKYKLESDVIFLVKKGLQKAKDERLNIIVGGTLLSTEDSSGEIYLPASDNKTNASNLIALVADEHPQVTKRIIGYENFIYN